MNATDLLPWSWTITAENPDESLCPSSSRVLGTFAIVNIVVSFLGTIFGHRSVINHISFGKFGKINSKAHRFMWLVSVTIQLGANAIIARIIKGAPGYKATFGIWELTMFFSARPRLAWIPLMALGCYEMNSPTLQAGSPSSSSQKDRPWASAAKSQAFSEIALQALALVTMGKTVRFAVSHRYFLLASWLTGSLPSEAKLMYGSAFALLICGTILLCWQIGFLFIYCRIIFLFANLYTFWLCSWLFWGGFVRLAGPLYCPPKLDAQGSIWGVFSLFSIILGAGAG